MMMNNDFQKFISEFLLNELPIIHNQSKNTIESYRDTYVQLIDFMLNIKKIKSNKIEIKHLTKEVIIDFLNWIENNQGNSISTRNQRLAAIHSLFRFIQMQGPEYMFQCQQIIGIPFKRNERNIIGYLDEEKTNQLLSTPDVSTKKGRRDQTLLCLLYDSGARVQELADLTVGDIRLDTPAQVHLTGKGRKTRSVPLMDKTILLIANYLKEQRLDNPIYLKHPLFYNTQRKKLTRQGITYILKKYADMCGIEKISPHIMRHTKAMHLTEANINPIFIRDFLGHTDLKVTEIYSKTSIKMKQEALEKLNKNERVLPEQENKEWTDDTELMGWLKNL